MLSRMDINKWIIPNSFAVIFSILTTSKIILKPLYQTLKNKNEILCQNPIYPSNLNHKL